MTRRFYITTPIYYPNGEPHLGHVYTTLCADVVARFHRLCGEPTWFLTGTDEHGIKMVKTAADLKIEPKALADKNVQIFDDLWRELKVTHDDFIRTTSDRHKVGVTKVYEKLLANGDIYLGAYEGWYDEGQEEFVTETTAKDNEYKSAISGRPLVRYKEPTYFFKLAKYVPQLIEKIEKDELLVRPESRKNEVLSKLKQGVEDLSISRSSLTWGIPLPNDPKHVLYVWIDALSNYITALDYPDGEKFKTYWPGVHLIGKEILWFHAVYWPAMLISLGEALPKQLFAHGWWTVPNSRAKMSKSLGNFIGLPELRAIISTYSLDALRYYMVRSAPFGNDLVWQDSEFAVAYTELGNVVGNLLNRTLNMIGKYRDGKVPPAGVIGAEDQGLVAPFLALNDELKKAYENLELQRAALLPVELARAANAYIDQTQPFKLAKDPTQAEQLDKVLNLCAQVCAKVLVALLPILPEKGAAGLKQLNVELEGKTLDDLLALELPPAHPLGKAEVLFPRIEK